MTARTLKSFLYEEAERQHVTRSAIFARIGKGQYPGLRWKRYNSRVVYVYGSPRWTMEGARQRHPELRGLDRKTYYRLYKAKRRARAGA